MLEFLSRYPIIASYLTVVSLISIITTVKDKICSKIGSHRTPEKRLLLLSALGGSVAMLLAMLLIRHKTKHLKFMIGIPLIIVLQVIAACCLNNLGVLI